MTAASRLATRDQSFILRVVSEMEQPAADVAPAPAPAASSAPATTPLPDNSSRSPRPLTPLVRRRAWGDIHVRFWWLSAIGVTLVIAYFSMTQVHRALRDRDIIRNGIPVQTIIKKAGERDLQGNSVLRERETEVILIGRLPGENEDRQFLGSVSAGPGYLKVGQPLPIRVSRANPEEWTERQEVTPWWRELAISLMFLPLIAALLIGAVVVRQRILRVWRSGVPIEGTVVELRHSAWAPLSRVVRYSLVSSADRRIFSTLAPTETAPAKGDTIQLLAPGNGVTRPTIMTRLYQA